jgi:hypothetical protein
MSSAAYFYIHPRSLSSIHYSLSSNISTNPPPLANIPPFLDIFVDVSTSLNDVGRIYHIRMNNRQELFGTLL